MLKVLLAEDDFEVAHVLKYVIEDSFAASVLYADTGAVAVHAMSVRHFDFAIIDVVLPDISGFELAERAANCATPVLLISGHPEKQLLCRLISYPHLDKPFSLRELVESATTILRDTKENIARVQQSYAKLMTTYEQAKRIVTESGRLVNDSRRTRAEIKRARLPRSDVTSP